MKRRPTILDELRRACVRYGLEPEVIGPASTFTDDQYVAEFLRFMGGWESPSGRAADPSGGKLNVFDFELSADEMAAINGLDTGRRGGPEPDAITLEAFGREIPEA